MWYLLTSSSAKATVGRSDSTRSDQSDVIEVDILIMLFEKFVN